MGVARIYTSTRISSLEAMATTTRNRQQPQHLALDSLANDINESAPHFITNMFGALNRFIARLDAAPEEQNTGSQAGFGFQVLRNTNPDVPLEPWFDFVIGINGRTIVSVTEKHGFL